MSQNRKYQAQVTSYAGLKSTARHISSQETTGENIRFVVGSAVIGKTNQIQILEYDDIQASIRCVQTLEHTNQVDWISCHPTDESEIITVSSDPMKRVHLASLYHINDTDRTKGEMEIQKMDHICDFDTTDAKRAFYVPNNPAKVVISESSKLRIFDVSRPESEVSFCKIDGITAACPDPLHSSHVAVSCGTKVALWDTRSSELAYEIENAHSPLTLDVAVNESKPWWICTGGSDGMMRCWDIRVGKTECEFRASSHWVTRVVPSTSHEQLIISAGTDSKVRVFNASKFAFQSEGKLPDGEIVKSIRHDDSVYCAAWSSSNPWVFASVSYKGQVNVCQLPSEVVDAILMGDAIVSD